MKAILKRLTVKQKPSVKATDSRIDVKNNLKSIVLAPLLRCLNVPAPSRGSHFLKQLLLLNLHNRRRMLSRISSRHLEAL